MPYYLGFIAGEETSQWPCSPEGCVAVQVNVCLCGPAGVISVCISIRERGREGEGGTVSPPLPLGVEM